MRDHHDLAIEIVSLDVASGTLQRLPRRSTDGLRNAGHWPHREARVAGSGFLRLADVSDTDSIKHPPSLGFGTRN
jgi:hypothetical protein